MKDKNQIIGFILIALVFFGYVYYNQPTEAELARHRQIQDSIAKVDESKAKFDSDHKNLAANTSTELQETALDTISDSLKTIQLNKKHGIFSTSASGNKEVFYIENDVVKLGISNLGGRVVSAVLKKYKTHDSLPLELVDEDSSQFYLSFYRNRNTIDQTKTHDLYFEKISQTNNAITLRLKTNESNRYIDFNYNLEGKDDYIVNFGVKTEGLDDLLASNSGEMGLFWEMNLLSQEKSKKNEQIATTAYYKYSNEDVEDLSPTNYDREVLVAGTKWISFKQQYFSSAIIANDKFGKTNAYLENIDLGEEEAKHVKGMRANVSLPFKGNEFNMQLFYGPNHYQILKDLDIGMEDQIALGWPIIRWVSTLIIIPTFNFLDNYIGSYGIIILLLTIFIKMLLLPITYKTYLSSARMKLIKPEVDAINKKYENKDAMEKQQATMALYRKTGVSPFAGCIPALIQMPILFAMFRFFPASIELRQQSFLWADDLSTYDSIMDLPFEIPFYGDHVSLFTILMAISIFFYSKFNMNTPSMGGGSGMQAQQMKLMMYMMPIMMLFFFNSSSSGLSYYYFAANIISILQQIGIKKFFINEEALLAKIEANKLKRKNVKKSSFQKRLEEMAKQKNQRK